MTENNQELLDDSRPRSRTAEVPRHGTDNDWTSIRRPGEHALLRPLCLYTHSARRRQEKLRHFCQISPQLSMLWHTGIRTDSLRNSIALLDYSVHTLPSTRGVPFGSLHHRAVSNPGTRSRNTRLRVRMLGFHANKSIAASIHCKSVPRRLRPHILNLCPSSMVRI